MSTDEKIKEACGDWLSQQNARLLDNLTYCESPIEELFLLAALTNTWEFGFYGDESTNLWNLPSAVAGRAAKKSPVGAPIILTDPGYPAGRGQFPVLVSGRVLRIDFAFSFGGILIAVELDGHDFHERTKDQAKKEKSRQRALTADGWNVLRFTGSEIYADAAACVSEVESVGNKLQLARLGRGGK